jgi:hypothetical protein
MGSAILGTTNQASSTASSVDALANATTRIARTLDRDEKHDALSSVLNDVPHTPASSNGTAIDEKPLKSKEGLVTTTPLTVVGGKDNVVQANNAEISKADGNIENQEEDEDQNVIYPKGLPLALLTFGLYTANLAVALGKS